MGKEEFFEKPAGMVQQADLSLTELATQIKEEIHLAEEQTRDAMFHYRKAGELLLKVWDRIPRGKREEWLAANAPFKTRQAQKYIRLVKEWERLKTECLSPRTDGAQSQTFSLNSLNLNGAMKVLSEEAPDEPDIKPAPTASTNGAPAASLPCRDCRVRGAKVATPGCKGCKAANAPSDPPVKAGKLCKECKAAGEGKPGCEGCRIANGGKRQPPTAPATAADKAREEHGAGADDGEVDKAQAEYEAERLKHISAPLFREMRKIGKTHGLQLGKDWKDWDPKFKNVLRAMWKARDVLRVLLDELQSESPKAAEGLAE